MQCRFGEFDLDTEERLLLRHGRPVEIGDRAFDLLTSLAESPGRLLAKDALMDAVWPNIFVTENNLQVQISSLRRLLGPDAIKTIAGRGYRFMLEVQAHEGRGVTAIAPRPMPPPAPDLIGRADDLAALEAILAHAGLVTLTGAGGIGKTSLARSLAARCGGRGCEVAWVDLAPVREPGLIAGLVAEACGLDPMADATAREIAAALAGRSLLLVVDNAEHMLDAVAGLVAELLAGASDLGVLATSQAPLRTPGERVYRLDGLDLPELDATRAALEASGAGALFLSRAQAMDRRFDPSPQDARAIASICRRLDGAPLAIELAAARVSLFGAQELERRLDQRFEVLTRGYRSAPTRQQTLQSVLEWSYGLLPDAERTLFRRLGAFSGPFPLEWAFAIGGPEGSTWQVTDALGGLLDRSLVEAVDPEGGAFRLTETARIFAFERLVEHGEAGAMASAVELYTRAGDEALERSARAAVGAYSAALGLQRAVSRIGGDRALELPLLLKLGPAVQTAISPADLRCRDLYAEAADLARAAEDPMALFHALWGLWHYHCMAGQLRAAEPLVAELEALSRRIGDGDLELEARHAHFTTHQLLGNAAEVVASSRQLRAAYDAGRHGHLAQCFGGHDAEICACGQGAVGLWLLGQEPEARAAADEAVRLAEAIAHPYSRAVGLYYAALAYQTLGQADAFARCADALRSLADAHGLAVLGSEGELMSGRVAFERGESQGLADMRRAYDAIVGSGDTGFGMYYAALIAEAYLEIGDRAAALEVIETAMGYAASGQGFFLPELYRLRAAARPASARADLERAIEIARQQRAKALEDRAAADLARLPALTA